MTNAPPTGDPDEPTLNIDHTYDWYKCKCKKQKKVHCLFFCQISENAKLLILLSLFNV